MGYVRERAELLVDAQAFVARSVGGRALVGARYVEEAVHVGRGDEALIVADAMRDPRVRMLALFLAPTLLALRMLVRIWLPGGLLAAVGQGRRAQRAA